MRKLIPAFIGLALAASGQVYANHTIYQGEFEVRTPTASNETASGLATLSTPAGDSVAHRHSPPSVGETGTPSNAWAPATPSTTGHVSAVPSSTKEIAGSQQLTTGTTK
jgi:hypothetical protein